MEALTREILEHCREAGFALAGVCGVERSRWERELRAWLAAGRHGTMAYLAEHLEVRLDPSRLLEGARSVVMVADLYARRGGGEERIATGRGRVARYARGADYHRVIKRRLHTLADRLRTEHPGAVVRVFTDTAPVLERELAERCGLGWIGKHTLLIHPRLGSYMLLGGLATTLELEASGERVADHCGTCRRCVEACPTGAISPYSVDATRCISYLTIEHRGVIDERFHEPMGTWLFGCDACQEACPHNSPLGLGERADDRPRPEYAPRFDSLDVGEVLRWTKEDRSRVLSGSAMKRATLQMLRRNAVIVAGNAGVLREEVERIAADEGESPIVREAALAVVRRAGAGAEALVQLVDASGRTVGTCGKLAAHEGEGRPHRAVSVVVFNGRGEVLLQRRARGKYHFGGVWTNTCCTHPRPGEGVVAAGRRRLREEMGIDLALREAGTFAYEARDAASGLVEREFDHVLTGRFDGQPRPDPAECEGWRWAGVEAIRREARAAPRRFSPWMLRAIEIAARGL